MEVKIQSKQIFTCFTETVNFWYGLNSQMLFSEHICPHDVNFQLGTWTLVYFADRTVDVAGLLSFDFGVSTFVVAPVGSTGSCSNLDSESTCLVPETSVIGNIKPVYCVTFDRPIQLFRQLQLLFLPT